MENLKILLNDVLNNPTIENKKHLINNFKMFLVKDYDKEDRNQSINLCPCCNEYS